MACAMLLPARAAALAALAAPFDSRMAEPFLAATLPFGLSLALSAGMLVHPRTRRSLWRGLILFGAYVGVLLLLLLVIARSEDQGALKGVLALVAPWMLVLLLLCGLITST